MFCLEQLLENLLLFKRMCPTSIRLCPSEANTCTSDIFLVNKKNIQCHKPQQIFFFFDLLTYSLFITALEKVTDLMNLSRNSIVLNTGCFNHFRVSLSFSILLFSTNNP